MAYGWIFFGAALGILIVILLAAAVAAAHDSKDLSMGIILLGIFALVAVIITVIFLPVQYVARRNCNYAEKKYARDTTWDYWAGCYIKFQNRYVSLGTYQAYISGK